LTWSFKEKKKKQCLHMRARLPQKNDPGIVGL
jgi:hypothetical protein